MATAPKKRMTFEYEPRTDEDIRKHKSASTGRTGFVIDGVKIFAPKAGNHTIRVLPPTWKDRSDPPKGFGKYFGVDLYAHYNIGPDGSAYLCPARMRKEPCAICDERKRAVEVNDDDLASNLRPNHRVACWVIDRNAEREGPQLFLMPHSLDSEINGRLQDKRTGDIYNVDDPDEGYDIFFTREGEGLKTKYITVEFSRKSSKLSEDEEEYAEWLAFVMENPVPDQLVFPTEDDLRDVVGDGLVFSSDAKKRPSAKKGRDEEEDDRRSTRSSPSRPRPVARDEEEEDDRSARRSKPSRDETEEDDRRPRASAASEPETEDEATEDEEESLKDRLAKLRAKRR